ncbi:MAG: hypothetical protein NTZ32_17055 [Planctomycetales bacterium]|nr:hypothetical protein [Planctomycetales bacterium]
MLIALGMEAMLTTSQADLPLPPAVKTHLKSESGDHDVLESEVLLEIENVKGERIVAQRTIKGERDKNLITVHAGPVLTALGTAAQTSDYFVSRDGAATREAGFHHFLAKFLGWELPTVQSFEGTEKLLYLQCVLPYFIVEQTRGWSTVQPPLPTHFRIRDTHKRAVEFLLNLDAHRIALRRQEILLEKTRIEADWKARTNQLLEFAESVAGTLQAMPRTPSTTWPPQIAPSLVVPVGQNWETLRQRIAARSADLSQLVEQEIPRVQEIASTAQAELDQAEHEIREKQTLLSRLLDVLESEQSEVKRIEHRLVAMDEDIQRNKDVRTLKQLGSRKGSSLDAGSCPICHQPVIDSLVPLAAEQAVMSLDENIDFLVEQKRTFEVVLENARRIADARKKQARSINDELGSLRDHIRALRQTLISDGRLPSAAAIRTRIELENAIRKDELVAAQFEKGTGHFGDLAERWRRNQEALLALPKDDVSAADRTKLTAWTQLIHSQLTQFGFGSCAVNQIVISPDSYKPEYEGFDLQTSLGIRSQTNAALQTSISASDLIRTIWAYLNGMLELARTSKTNHPGCVIFDEPRQQSTRDVSFAELLKRASTAADSRQQVILFTSENLDRLRGHLSMLPHSLRSIDGRVLQKLSGDNMPATPQHGS